MQGGLPSLAIILGTAGLIPFAVFGFLAVGLNPQASAVAASGLVGYGAVILAFLGGVHWGFALDHDGDGRAQRARLGLGVIPSLVGWVAMLLAVGAHPALGLAVLIAGYIGTLVAEIHAHRRDLTPPGYLTLRWMLTVVVVCILTAVMVVRLIGGHVLL